MSQGLKITSDTSDAIKQKILDYLDASSCGTFRVACRVVGIAPSTAYVWRKEDAAFDEAVKFKRWCSKEIALDFAEYKLMERIKNDDLRAIMYFLDAKGKDRGYGRHRVMEFNAGRENPVNPPRFVVVFSGVHDVPTPPSPEVFV